MSTYLKGIERKYGSIGNYSMLMRGYAILTPTQNTPKNFIKRLFLFFMRCIKRELLQYDVNLNEARIH